MLDLGPCPGLHRETPESLTKATGKFDDARGENARPSQPDLGVRNRSFADTFRRCGISAGTGCNACRVRGFVTLSGVTGTAPGHEDRLRAGVHPQPEPQRPV